MLPGSQGKRPAAPQDQSDLATGRAVQQAASREAFEVVAGATAAALKAKGYQITAPPSAKPYGWLPPSSRHLED